MPSSKCILDFSPPLTFRFSTVLELPWRIRCRCKSPPLPPESSFLLNTPFSRYFENWFFFSRHSSISKIIYIYRKKERLETYLEDLRNVRETKCLEMNEARIARSVMPTKKGRRVSRRAGKKGGPRRFARDTIRKNFLAASYGDAHQSWRDFVVPWPDTEARNPIFFGVEQREK